MKQSLATLTTCLLLGALCGGGSLEAAGTAGTEDSIAQLRARISQQEAAALAKDAGKPLVRDKILKDWKKRGDFTRKYNQSILEFANRVFALEEKKYMAEANAALREMCKYHLDRPQTLFEIHSFPGAVSHLAGLYLLYGPNGSKAPGRMSPETCGIVEKTLWEWGNEKSKIADAEVKRSQTWWIHNSENHHASHFFTCWKIAGVLKDLPAFKDKAFKDGHTPAAHHQAWTDYAKEYIRERARKGMLVEIDSPSYGPAVVGCVDGFHTLSTDPELKKLAGMFMELFWALVAEEQFNGALGGAQTRSYPKHTVTGNSLLTGRARAVFGLGGGYVSHADDGVAQAGENVSEGDDDVPAAAGVTAWEVPDVVLSIAHGWPAKAPYEIRQRRMGLVEPGYARPPNYRFRTDFGGLLRYTWCTPDYIMGSFMHEPRPVKDWAAISSQFRWAGVIFAGDQIGRVFPEPTTSSTAPILNGFWSVQSKGTMIAQRLTSGKQGQLAKGEGWRVFFSKAGLSEPVTEGEWTFAQAKSAYVAVRVVSGKATFKPTPLGRSVVGQWLVCEDPLSPVIIEAGRTADFPDFESFKKSVSKRPVLFEGGVLHYESLCGDKLTFYSDRSHLPEINGNPVNLAPDKVYDSPFVKSKWDSGVVGIRYGDEVRILDFNK